jgi:hypothetical protein
MLSDFPEAVAVSAEVVAESVAAEAGSAEAAAALEAVEAVSGEVAAASVEAEPSRIRTPRIQPRMRRAAYKQL